MAKPRKTKPKAASVVPTIKAPEVEELARDLIERQHHGLRGAVIKYGFTTKKSKRFGRVVLVREEVQTLTERKVCFLVIVSKLYWDAYEKDPVRREAALDELLCSMSYDGMTPRIEKIDFKGYRKNVLRYGVQTDELAEAFKGFQLVLPAMADIERELAEPTPPPRCDDCGEPVDGARMGQEGVPLCEACWKFMSGLLDPDSSTADDEGEHCEGGCGKFLRAGALQEMPDAKLLCYKCREASTDSDCDGDDLGRSSATVDGVIGGDGTTMADLVDDSEDEPAGGNDGALDGIDWTEHAPAAETAAETAGVA